MAMHIFSLNDKRPRPCTECRLLLRQKGPWCCRKGSPSRCNVRICHFPFTFDSPPPPFSHCNLTIKPPAIIFFLAISIWLLTFRRLTPSRELRVSKYSNFITLVLSRDGKKNERKKKQKTTRSFSVLFLWCQITSYVSTLFIPACRSKTQTHTHANMIIYEYWGHIVSEKNKPHVLPHLQTLAYSVWGVWGGCIHVYECTCRHGISYRMENKKDKY